MSWGGRHESWKEQEQRVKREALEAERYSSLPLIPPTGPIWESIQASHPDIPAEDLRFLLALVIEFWWHGEIRCEELEPGSMHERTWVKLGRRFRTRCVSEEYRTLPAQYVIIVRNRQYLVVHKDFEMHDDGAYLNENGWVEVGICPDARIGEWYYDRDMRESPGYRQVLHLPQPEMYAQPDRLPDWLDAEVARYDRLGNADQKAVDVLVKVHWDEQAHKRALTLVAQAWQLQFLLFIWCGIVLQEEVWQSVMRGLLAPPKEDGHARSQWGEALRKFSLNDEGGLGDSDVVNQLQAMVILQIANYIRQGGRPNSLNDPFNPRGPGFNEALCQFRDLPGFRKWSTSLFTMKEQQPRVRRSWEEDQWD